MTAGTTDHTDALTGVRAYAALSVVAFHAWLTAGSPAIRVGTGAFSIDLSRFVAYGWIGVDIFFVLSGYLLTRVAIGRLARAGAPAGRGFVARFGESWWSFLRRRILRVYPAYYACLTVLLALAATGIYLRVPENLDMFMHLFMVHNFVERYIVTINGVFWTLPFEFHFYLAFPLLFVAMRRLGPLALYACAVAVVLATKTIVLATNDGYPQVLLFIRIDAFCAGMAAGAATYHRPISRSRATLAFAAGLAGLLAIPFAFAEQRGVVHYYDLLGFVRPFWIQASICLLLVAITGSRTRGVALFDNRIVVWLGLVSYSIYLWHVPLLELLPTLGLGAGDAPASAPRYARVLLHLLPVLIAVSALSYYAIERPFQTAGRRRPAPPGGSRIGLRFAPIPVLAAWAVALMLATLAANAGMLAR